MLNRLISDDASIYSFISCQLTLFQCFFFSFFFSFIFSVYVFSFSMVRLGLCATIDSRQ